LAFYFQSITILSKPSKRVPPPQYYIQHKQQTTDLIDYHISCYIDSRAELRTLCTGTDLPYSGSGNCCIHL